MLKNYCFNLEVGERGFNAKLFYYQAYDILEAVKKFLADHNVTEFEVYEM